MTRQLKLRIHSVKCVDETGGKYFEKLGNDEIYLSGFTIDGEGKTTKIPAFNIYSNFDDGEMKKYDPPHTFTTFTLSDTKSWPKDFGVCFLLFERDSGDMNEALDRAYQKFKEEVDSKMVSAKGSDKNSFEIPWEIIFTTIIPMVAKYLQSIIASAISDDPFPLESVSLKMPGQNFDWGGNNTSPINKVEFRGNDGVYYLFYDWELIGKTEGRFDLPRERDHRTS